MFHYQFFDNRIFLFQAGETALHSVAGICPGGKSTEEDLVNCVRLLLEHGANLTLTTCNVSATCER